MFETITPHISIPIEAIQQFCQRWKVVECALFGSVLRDDFRPNSDIDVLLTYRPQSRLTLNDLIMMGDELEDLFEHPVDLLDRETLANSPNALRRRIIFETAQVIYAG
jgi:hypothetical protein